MQPRSVLSLLLVHLGGIAVSAYAQGTSFTYQGQLKISDTPANGIYDLRFSLFSTSIGAGQIGSSITNSSANISNGLFTVTLDFGGQFSGAGRWLEIGVRTNGGSAFSILSPRQTITPTPQAIFAATAGVASSLSGSLAGDVTGTQGNTTVFSVAGYTAAAVASGASTANAATSANVPGTIVKRDGSGNFSAGNVTGAFFGDGSGLTQLQASAVSGTLTNNTTGYSMGASNLYLGSAGGIYAGNSNVVEVTSNVVGQIIATTNQFFFRFAGPISDDTTFYNVTNGNWHWSAARNAYTNAGLPGYGVATNTTINSQIAYVVTNSLHHNITPATLDVLAMGYFTAFSQNSSPSEDQNWLDDQGNPIGDGNSNMMQSYFPSANAYNYVLKLKGMDGSGLLNLNPASINAGTNLGLSVGHAQSAITNQNNLWATNQPTHGYSWNVSKVPLLGWDEWNVAESNLTPYASNGLAWATNTILATKSNYLAYGWDTIFITDSWQADNRTTSGELTWSTNKYPYPRTLPWLIDFAHANGMKIVLYTSIGTTTCIGKPGSGIENIYRDIQTMMSWGADGTMIDVCNGINYSDKNYRRAFIRLLNQAVEDYHEMAIATNGIVRPFYIQQTLGWANNTADYFDMDEIYGASAWSISYGINYASYKTNTLATGRLILNKMRQFIGPGRFAWAESAYENGFGLDIKTNLINIFTMTCQPWRGAFGYYTNPTFTNGSPGHAVYIANAARAYTFTNTEVLNLWRDPSCVPARIIRTNDFTELWIRPILGGAIGEVSQTNCIFWFNRASTNFTATCRTADFGGFNNTSYTVRNPWTRQNLMEFTNQFSVTIPPNDGLLLVTFPTQSKDASAQHFVGSGGTPTFKINTNSVGGIGVTGSVVIEGTDSAFVVTATPNSSSGGPTYVGTNSFSRPYSAIPKIVITPANTAAADLLYPMSATSISTNGFVLRCGGNGTLGASTTYKWSFIVFE